jgi:hypothetical protein
MESVRIGSIHNTDHESGKLQLLINILIHSNIISTLGLRSALPVARGFGAIGSHSNQYSLLPDLDAPASLIGIYLKLEHLVNHRSTTIYCYSSIMSCACKAAKQVLPVAPISRSDHRDIPLSWPCYPSSHAK